MRTQAGFSPGSSMSVWRRRSPWGLIVLALLVGVALIRSGVSEFSGPPQPTAKSAADSRSATSPAAPSATPPPKPLPASTPTRVAIPAIRVNAPLTPVGLDAKGWIEPPPPQDKNLGGWYKGGVTPGENGTSVIVGHVDNKAGPAVFYNLGALRKGYHVEVTREDGRTAVFAIYGIEVFNKQPFPADRVYGTTGRPELRVITCGGVFSKAGGYTGNVVVFARLDAVR